MKKGKKEEENLPMKCFVTHLKKQLGLQEIECGADKDPPDFWCKIKGKKYAVEVTRIVNKLDRIPKRSEPLDFPEYKEWLKQISKRIAQEAKEQDCLAGGYAVFTIGTPNIPKKAEEITLNAVKYICKTQTLTRENGETLYRDQGGKIGITKVNNDKSYVSACPALAKSEGKIKQDLEKLLKHRISDKIKRLIKPNVPKYDGTILVIYDQYKFGDPEDYPKMVEGMEFFCSVFLVLDVCRERGCFLYTKDKTWDGK